MNHTAKMFAATAFLSEEQAFDEWVELVKSVESGVKLEHVVLNRTVGGQLHSCRFWFQREVNDEPVVVHCYTTPGISRTPRTSLCSEASAEGSDATPVKERSGW